MYAVGIVYGTYYEWLQKYEILLIILIIKFRKNLI